MRFFVGESEPLNNCEAFNTSLILQSHHLCFPPLIFSLLMALSSPHIQRLVLTKLHGPSTSNHTNRRNGVVNISRGRCCSAIAIDTPSSLADVAGIRWGSIALQGLREEMEDAILLRPNSLNGFSFAAVFDGHGGFSSVAFLR